MYRSLSSPLPLRTILSLNSTFGRRREFGVTDLREPPFRLSQFGTESAKALSQSGNLLHHTLPLSRILRFDAALRGRWELVQHPARASPLPF
jgi:hypothetical protein